MINVTMCVSMEFMEYLMLNKPPDLDNVYVSNTVIKISLTFINLAVKTDFKLIFKNISFLPNLKCRGYVYICTFQ